MKVTINGKTVTSAHTDAMQKALNVNVIEKWTPTKRDLVRSFMIAGHVFKSRRDLANHLLTMIHTIPTVNVEVLKKAKSASLPAFTIEK